MPSEFWTNVKETMGHYAKAIPVLPGPDTDRLAEWLQANRSWCDTAVEVWIDAKEWPALSDSHRWHLQQRLYWGWELSILMSMNDWPCPSYDQAYRWLLIDSWQAVGLDSFVRTARLQALEPGERSSFPAR